MKAISVNAQEVAQQLTLHVRLHGVQMLRLRTWVGAHFLRLGAWVIGCGIVIEQDGKPIISDEWVKEELMPAINKALEGDKPVG